jgi:hypothetical protein
MQITWETDRFIEEQILDHFAGENTVLYYLPDPWEVQELMPLAIVVDHRSYNKLWSEYKKYPDTSKIWNLTVNWVNESASGNTNVKITWKTADITNSEYNTVTLYNKDYGKVMNMKTVNQYIFNIRYCNFGHMMENKTNAGLDEVTCYLKLPVYTREGIYIGHL